MDIYNRFLKTNKELNSNKVIPILPISETTEPNIDKIINLTSIPTCIDSIFLRKSTSYADQLTFHAVQYKDNKYVTSMWRIKLVETTDGKFMVWPAGIEYLQKPASKYFEDILRHFSPVPQWIIEYLSGKN